MPENDMSPEKPNILSQAEDIAAETWKKKFDTSPNTPLLDSPDLTRDEYIRLLKEREKTHVSPEQQQLKEIYQQLTSTLEIIGVTPKSSHSGKKSNSFQLIGANGNFYVEFASPNDFNGHNEIFLMHGYKSELDEEQKIETTTISSRGNASIQELSLSSGEEIIGEISDKSMENKEYVIHECQRMANLISIPILEPQHAIPALQARLKIDRDVLFSYLESKNIKPDFKNQRTTGQPKSIEIEIPGTDGEWGVSFLQDYISEKSDDKEPDECKQAHGIGIFLVRMENQHIKENFEIWENGDARFEGPPYPPTNVKDFVFKNEGRMDHFNFHGKPETVINNPHGLVAKFEEIVRHIPVGKLPANKKTGKGLKSLFSIFLKKDR